MAIRALEGAGERRPRVRVNAEDLVPERRPVMEVAGPPDEHGQRTITVHWGYVWGPRIPGTLEARVLQDWNRGRDPATSTVEDVIRRREVLEEAVLHLVDTLDASSVSVINSTDLVAILQDLEFLLPPDPASAADEQPIPPPEATETTST